MKETALLLLLLLDIVTAIAMAIAKTSQEISYKHPTFPILPLPHHFGDYGFDPHIHNFQAYSEEPRRIKRETRVLGALHSKQQKPISKEDSKNKNKKKRWWKNALLFWKYWKSGEGEQQPHNLHHQGVEYRHMYRVEPGSETPSRSGRSGSKPVAGSLTPRRKGDVETRYLSLTELNLKPQERWISNSSMPIYMVT